MSKEPGEELLSISAEILEAERQFSELAKITVPVTNAAQKVGESWSGSNLGYHSRVYFRNLDSPPPGASFNVQVGLEGAYYESSHEGWTEYRFDAVRDYIYQAAGNPDLSEVRERGNALTKLFEVKKAEVESILSIADTGGKDPYLQSLKAKVGDLRVHSYDEIGRSLIRTGQIITRDYTAMSQSRMTAPHQTVLADMMSLSASAYAAKTLSDLSKQAGSHLTRAARQNAASALVGTNIFIGHGRSGDWRVLKDFVHERLALPYDEFNRVPVAGITNIARLSEMLSASAFALVVLTAEDEQADGRMHARMNVVHEVGLFQGKLGFTRAIVLLEDGCEEFSNIQGLGQIRFPAGRIDSTFEEVRQVLEREGVLSD